MLKYEVLIKNKYRVKLSPAMVANLELCIIMDQI